MARNERTTCKELIEPALANVGWDWEEQLRIGPGRVNLTGDSPESMYDETQEIVADYLLRHRGIPLAILEAKAESESAADGMQQASRYAQRLLIRFSIASNGKDWILTNDGGVDIAGLEHVVIAGSIGMGFHLDAQHLFVPAGESGSIVTLDESPSNPLHMGHGLLLDD